jgi:hypothetical protein
MLQMSAELGDELPARVERVRSAPSPSSPRAIATVRGHPLATTSRRGGLRAVNDRAQQRGRQESRHSSEHRYAGPVRCSGVFGSFMYDVFFSSQPSPDPMASLRAREKRGPITLSESS